MHDLNKLFEQLGLDASEKGIDRFISDRSPLAPALSLHDAPFWSPAQATFIREAVLEDANWSYAVDQLDTRLR